MLSDKDVLKAKEKQIKYIFPSKTVPFFVIASGF
jgi:hypothetical protein